MDIPANDKNRIRKDFIKVFKEDFNLQDFKI